MPVSVVVGISYLIFAALSLLNALAHYVIAPENTDTLQTVDILTRFAFLVVIVAVAFLLISRKSE